MEPFHERRRRSPFSVTLCTVNEEFAISRDGSWRCIHAWECRVPVIWPVVQLKTRHRVRVLSHRWPVTRLPWGPAAEENFRGDHRPAGPHIELPEHADWAIKACFKLFRGNSPDSSLLFLCRKSCDCCTNEGTIVAEYRRTYNDSVIH